MKLDDPFLPKQDAITFMKGLELHFSEVAKNLKTADHVGADTERKFIDSFRMQLTQLRFDAGSGDVAYKYLTPAKAKAMVIDRLRFAAGVTGCTKPPQRKLRANFEADVIGAADQFIKIDVHGLPGYLNGESDIPDELSTPCMMDEEEVAFFTTSLFPFGDSEQQADFAIVKINRRNIIEADLALQQLPDHIEVKELLIKSGDAIVPAECELATNYDDKIDAFISIRKDVPVHVVVGQSMDAGFLIHPESPSSCPVIFHDGAAYLHKVTGSAEFGAHIEESFTIPNIVLYADLEKAMLDVSSMEDLREKYARDDVPNRVAELMNEYICKNQVAPSAPRG